MNASVKENPPPERNYKQRCARLGVRFASLCTTAHLHHPTISEGQQANALRTFQDDASSLRLLTGLRSEGLRRIEKAAAPEGLI